MAKVYILNVYGEYGPEEITATVDREKLPTLLQRYFAPPKWKYHAPDVVAVEHQKALTKFNTLDLSVDDTHELQDGWGGIQLSVVELD